MCDCCGEEGCYCRCWQALCRCLNSFSDWFTGYIDNRSFVQDLRCIGSNMSHGNFNCYGWAIEPITGNRMNINPANYAQNNVDVNVLATAITSDLQTRNVTAVSQVFNTLAESIANINQISILLL